MMRSLNTLQGSVIGATDGDIGKVTEAIVDDDKWTMRYLVVDTGGWLERPVLISPVSVERIDWTERRVGVSLTKDQVRNSPSFESASPITRDYEMAYFGYYGYGPYWVGTGIWGESVYPATLAGAPLAVAKSRGGKGPAAAVQERDRPLHPSGIVIGSHVQATDGEIGHVDDILFDDETWQVRYLRLDTSNWIGGKPVVIAAGWVRGVSWPDRKVHVALTREAVENSPRYDPDRLNREYESSLYRHYGMRGYWED